MTNEQKFEILKLLHSDSRLSVDTLAKMLNAPVDEIQKAIEELERDKLILRYSVVVNWDKVESRRVTAVIDVKVVPQREVGFDAIAKRIYLYPEVKSVDLMSGAYDLQVTVEGNDLREVSQFVAQKLATIDGVTSTTTHFLLKTYKSDGVIFDDPDADRRMVVHP